MKWSYKKFLKVITSSGGKFHHVFKWDFDSFAFKMWSMTWSNEIFSKNNTFSFNEISTFDLTYIKSVEEKDQPIYSSVWKLKYYPVLGEGNNLVKLILLTINEMTIKMNQCINFYLMLW